MACENKTISAGLCLCLTIVGAIGPEVNGQDDMIQTVIDAFEPAWMPPRGELPRAVVMLHAAGGGAETARQRAIDDMNLLTAAHLYHLIKRGGANAVLTRVDDRPLPLEGETLAAALARRSKEARAHVLVAIDFSPVPPGPPGPPPQVDEELSQTLTRALGGADGVGAAVAIQIPGPGLPAVTCYVKRADTGASSSQRARVHRMHARTFYEALGPYLKAHHSSLETSRSRRWAEPPSPGQQPLPSDPERRRRHRLSGRARSIWPDGNLPVDKASWFASLFRQTALSDLTAVYFEPEVKVEAGTVVIEGATSVPALSDILVRVLKVVGIKDARNDMRLLPDKGKLGDELYGACRSPMALTFGDATELSVAQTQLFLGEPVYLLDKEAGFLLVQAGDGYCGWVRENAVQLMDGEQFAAYTRGRWAVLLEDVERPGLRGMRGTRLPIAAKTPKGLTLATPGGRRLDVPAAGASIIDHTAQLEKRAKAALTILYKPYIFAGRSPLGLDCSGLITNVCDQEGTPIARDAAQQFLSGKLVATRWFRDGIRPGDRLYFINEGGKIYHTGIAISPTHVVHAAPPEVQINSLRKGDRLYSERLDLAFLAAKRP